ncbi:MAG TPA: hypothetical protein VF515_12875 [Candidatus Binatia bacterium]
MSAERLRAHPELRTVLELDAQTYEELEQRAATSGKRSALHTLRATIAGGRMEIVNGTYAQPLAPTIGGEANIRHFFYGLDAVERILHAKVDSFVAGEPQFFPQLPQILAGFGIGNTVLRTHTRTEVSFRLEAHGPSGRPSARPWGIQTVLLGANDPATRAR